MEENRPVPVPLSDWGRDHWSTFGYLETRVVDYGGVLNVEHMRCDPRLHPSFSNRANRDVRADTPRTRLAGDRTIEAHDDWSCVEDAIELGLVSLVGSEASPAEIRGALRAPANVAWRRNPPDEFMPGRSPRFALTERGQKAAAALRAHKGAGLSFSTFHWTGA